MPDLFEAFGEPVHRTPENHDECDPKDGPCHFTYTDFPDDRSEPGYWVREREARLLELVAEEAVWAAENRGTVAEAESDGLYVAAEALVEFRRDHPRA